MTTSTQHPIFGIDIDRPLNDFVYIANTDGACQSCSDYLTERFRRDPDPRFRVLFSESGGFAALLRRKGEPPPRVRVAVVNVLARRGVEAFPRLWLMSRKKALSDKLYRRFANRLAVFSMPLLGKKFVGALDVLVSLKAGKLIEAHDTAQRVWDRTVVEAPHLTALARAMVAATQEDPYLAATEPIGWIMDACAGYDVDEYGILKRLSGRLAFLCGTALGGYRWKLQNQRGA